MPDEQRNVVRLLRLAADRFEQDNDEVSVVLERIDDGLMYVGVLIRDWMKA